MYENQWSLRVYANPGIIGLDLGEHIKFFNGDSEGDTYVPYMTSPHVNILEGSEATKAYARLNSFLRLVNGIKTLLNQNTIGSSKVLHCNMRDTHYEENIDTLVEELANPFDKNILLELPEWNRDSNRVTGSEDMYKEPSKEPSIYKDYLQLIINEPIVREVVLLLTLSEEQVIYLLVNTYKIFENIRHDLKLTPKLKPNESNLPDSLLDALRKIDEHNNFINAREVSGIFCRHGERYKEKKGGNTSTLEAVRKDLIFAINQWMNYKCISQFGRDYDPQPIINVDPFKDFR
ncbi:hypothetical protein ABE244_06165 [Bacillus toyonensis]|uniref:hypothetical protein n=1 Tax=Bacillus toyonensis TaxID=155322 RepID=UPI003D244B82